MSARGKERNLLPSLNAAAATAVFGTASPIHSVPHDILLAIFQAYRQLLYDGTEHWSNVWWLRSLTHVCRRWRQLAIGSPLLWTRMIAETPQITSLFLARSGDLLLDVDVEFEMEEGDDESEDSEKMESVFLCSQRIRSLKIAVIQDVPDALRGAQPHMFPQLIKLDICGGHEDWELVDLPLFLDDPDYLPRLQHLRLCGYSLDKARNLIHNHIRTLDLNPPVDGDPTELLQTLSRLAGGSLEELSFRSPNIWTDVGSDGEVHLPTVAHPILLPHLRKLYLDSTAETCGCILPQIVTPEIRNLILRLAGDSPVHEYECEDLDFDSGRYPSLAPSGVKHMISALKSSVPTAVKRIATLHVVWGSRRTDCLSILAWASTLPPSLFFSLLEVDPDDHVPAVLPVPPLQASLDNFSATGFMISLRYGLDLHNLTMLSLTETSPPYAKGANIRLHYQRLIVLFRQAPSITTLSISRYMSTDLAKALSSTDGHNRQILPLLEVLNIGLSSWNFSKKRSHPPPFNDLPPLIESLHARAAVCGRLDVLRMPHYFLDNLQQEVEKLKSCATTVFLTRSLKADVVWKATSDA